MIWKVGWGRGDFRKRRRTGVELSKSSEMRRVGEGVKWNGFEKFHCSVKTGGK